MSPLLAAGLIGLAIIVASIVLVLGGAFVLTHLLGKAALGEMPELPLFRPRTKPPVVDDKILVPPEILEYCMQESESWAFEDRMSQAKDLYRKTGNWATVMLGLQWSDGQIKKEPEAQAQAH